MPIDEEFLRRHDGFRDAQLGIAEQLLRPQLGGARTVAALTRPLATARPVGWVICHSFAREQVELGQLDVWVARGLAAAGFPVLRFHSQGYGDSRLRMQDVTLRSHLAGAADAVALMAEQEGVRQVGVFGARFGGTVAALAAERLGLEFLAVWEPITRGAAYMREFLRSQILFEVARAREKEERQRSLKDELLEQGWVDVQGFSLSREAYEEIVGVDLQKDVATFHRPALVGSVTRSGTAGSESQKFAAHLRSLGSACQEEVVQHLLGPEFGRRHYLNSGGTKKTDLQLDLSQAVAERTVAWALEAVAGERPAGPAPMDPAAEPAMGLDR
jgi:pimeloyl-ACP methyl ester carboxylesterase